MFKESFKKLKSTKYLTLLALFIALKIVVGYFKIPVSDNLNIYFTFVVTAIECIIFGYGPSMLSGIITDNLGYIVNPYPPYFPGYALSNVLAAFFYCLFLYNKKEIKIYHIIGAKLCVNLFVNVLMGSYWSSLLYGKAFVYYAAKSIVKNLTLLPIEVIILYFVLKLLIPVMKKRNIIDRI